MTNDDFNKEYEKELDRYFTVLEQLDGFIEGSQQTNARFYRAELKKSSKLLREMDAKYLRNLPSFEPALHTKYRKYLREQIKLS